MLISFNRQSRFFAPIADAFMRQGGSLAESCPIAIKLDGVSYDGEVVISLTDQNGRTFTADWQGSEPRLFPEEFRAAATVLREAGQIGDFRMSYTDGLLILTSVAKATASSEAGSEWSGEEIDAAVRGYLWMVSEEQEGRSYNKAKLNQSLRQGPLKKRSRGAVEYRMQNISSVLNQHGIPWLRGYKPAANVGPVAQRAVIKALEAHAPEAWVDRLPTDDPEVLERRSQGLRKQGQLPAPKGQQSPGRSNQRRVSYLRDPAVKAWVLQEAKGQCELCGTVAPFLLSDGSPYLEVHHVRPLAEDGSDTITNAVALCPNCHRRCHLSADRDTARSNLYQHVDRLVIE